ncbi:8-oxoguanine-DNA glycosylase 1 [Wolffia australiana]
MASHAWELVGVARVELSLPLTLPTGQTFRWRKTGAEQFTGVVGRHLLSLKHEEGDPQGHVAFLAHGGAAEAAAAGSAIREYLNLDVAVSVAAMWQEFAAADVAFAELARRLDGGVRILKQDPVECLFQFLCSSNNNIGRIQRMVENLASLGECIGTVDGVDFYRFPGVDLLASVSEEDLRRAGFGYRAGFVVNAARALREKPGGGVTWLESLREMELAECIEALCTLPGVGPKVAACVALFSLDHHHAIPVDTHVWQIATRDLIPELAGSRISPKHYGRISEAFVRRYGKYAGWAQAALFVGELPSQKKKEPWKRKQSTT